MTEIKCEKCNRSVSNHMVFCVYATPRQQCEFFRTEMLDAIERFWLASKKADRILAEMKEQVGTTYMSVKDAEFHAVQEPARKAAIGMTQFQMARATMYANAITATEIVTK